MGTVTAGDASAAARANSAWLEDCCARLLCVLALDRFGDYVSDKVVAYSIPYTVICKLLRKTVKLSNAFASICLLWCQTLIPDIASGRAWHDQKQPFISCSILVARKAINGVGSDPLLSFMFLTAAHVPRG